MKTSKTKPFLLLIVATLAVGLFLGGVNQAVAAATTFSQDTTWAAGVGNITIVSGSNVDEITTTSTTLTVTVSAGQYIDLVSTNRLLLINNGDFGYICDNTQSFLKISVATGGATKTVTVTPSSTNCDNPGGSGGGASSTPASTPMSTPTPTPTSTSPTPTPTATPVASVTPTPTPSTGSGVATPASKGFVSLAAVNLKDGDVVSAAGSSDPDIYIVNPSGYKRLFLNPAIFGFYGHLGGFSKVKSTTPKVRDTFVTSGLFRNCETNDQKVYGVEVTSEDAGVLHWVNTTGAQAVADDPNFFKKVFCINTKEFNWYPKGSNYTSVNQIPNYSRGSVLGATDSKTSNQFKVVGTDFLNVRSFPTVTGPLLGKIPAGDKIVSLEKSNSWHRINYQGQTAWVHETYLEGI